MSAKLANAPVYYALVQVRFNPVALMAKFAAEMQDRLRRSGYPIFEALQSQHFEFDPSQPVDAKPTVIDNSNWFFTSTDKLSGYVLGSNFFTFQTTNYSDHENFFAAFNKGLELLNEIASIGTCSRLGIRYLDAVIPNEDESLNAFLDPKVQGVDFGFPWIGSAWESGFETEEGVLVAKIYKTRSSLLGFPNDLQPRSLVMNEKFSLSEPKAHAVIDIDHFTEAEIDIDTSDINSILTNLHAQIGKCFRAIATDHAFSRWSQR